METKLCKWGNSLALRLPKQFAESRRLSEGVNLEIRAERDGFFVRALPEKLTLAELLQEVRPENLHGESFADGSPQGKEIW
jgi:antitoxin MazE